MQSFEDAVDDLPDVKPSAHGPTLEEAILDAVHIVDHFYTNEFKTAFKLCEKWANDSLYHSLGSAFLNFLRAWMTLEKVLADLIDLK